MIPGGIPGTKVINVVFLEIKLKKMIRNHPLFKPNKNK
jgi:hypothetical protein